MLSLPSLGPACTAHPQDSEPSLSQGPSSSLHLSGSSVAHGIFQHTTVPTIVLDSSFIIRDVSDSYIEVSGGYTREEILGLHFDAFFQRRPALPLTAARKAIRAALESRKPCDLDGPYVDGSICWSARIIPFYCQDVLLHFLMEFRDITDEHRRQLELEERHSSNEIFRIFVEAVKDYAIFMLDPRGNVATWNAGAEKFKGYKREEIIGRHFSDFYSQEDKNDNKPGRELDIALKEGRVEDEGWRYRKDGSKFWCVMLSGATAPH